MSDDLGSFLTYLPTLIRYHQMEPDLPTLISDVRYFLVPIPEQNQQSIFTFFFSSCKGHQSMTYPNICAFWDVLQRKEIFFWEL